MGLCQSKRARSACIPVQLRQKCKQSLNASALVPTAVETATRIEPTRCELPVSPPSQRWPRSSRQIFLSMPADRPDTRPRPSFRDSDPWFIRCPSMRNDRWKHHRRNLSEWESAETLTTRIRLASFRKHFCYQWFDLSGPTIGDWQFLILMSCDEIWPAYDANVTLISRDSVYLR